METTTLPPASIHTLPPEILIEILKSLPTFTTLRSLLLTQRVFHTLWKSNQRPITSSIAHTHFHPLPEALDLLLSQQNPTTDATPPAPISAADLTPKDLSQMCENTRRLASLEADGLGSWSWCDLSQRERERWRAAAYRYWALSLALCLPRMEQPSQGMGAREYSKMQGVGKRVGFGTGWEAWEAALLGYLKMRMRTGRRWVPGDLKVLRLAKLE